MPGKQNRGQRQQYAALPWRENHSLEIMLISSRETRRWIIPKGWPMPELLPHETAMREAFEEAGIEGEIEAQAIGSYRYLKRLRGRKAVTCIVDIFPMRVSAQVSDWPERHERTTQWFTPEQAAATVSEPDLASIIRNFALSRQFTRKAGQSHG